MGWASVPTEDFRPLGLHKKSGKLVFLGLDNAGKVNMSTNERRDLMGFVL